TATAGRGFEYGRAAARLTLRPDDAVTRDLTVRREVPTAGYAACDPHVHTLTYSGHGDATVGERVLTLAGEGIELPIATEHNRQVDYAAAAVAHRVRQYFTPVVGNEVTTRVGHVNAFPLAAGGPLPDAEVRDWKALALTPVGASDSHDVSRFIVGQGRTYVRCRDDRPGEIDVAEAVASFRAGRVLVSCGLLAEITVNGRYGPGDLAPAADEITVAVRVLGPAWAPA